MEERNSSMPVFVKTFDMLLGGVSQTEFFSRTEGTSTGQTFWFQLITGLENIVQMVLF